MSLITFFRQFFAKKRLKSLPYTIRTKYSSYVPFCCRGPSPAGMRGPSPSGPRGPSPAPAGRSVRPPTAMAPGGVPPGHPGRMTFKLLPYALVSFEMYLLCLNTLCFGMPVSQLSEMMVAKHYRHKNGITKSKQKDRAYFWTIPFFVK